MVGQVSIHLHIISILIQVAVAFSKVFGANAQHRSVKQNANANSGKATLAAQRAAR